ncbi:unnamed protein product [Prunus armeniaca]|uniref:non-specific serine/threonine protein kinase n=1 Tax=Prunus armeniaca TaxID=36596 RepID=A0A6J5WUZ9_PRUAR|nr:unnamed protein product [Prunus armeniaca]
MTGINYISDETFISTGENNVVLQEYRNKYQEPYMSLRSFPAGIRNCYKINVTNGTKYLIRSSFKYGNYDRQNILPEFELQLGTNVWDSVKLEDASTITNKELIHVPLRDYIHVCLVNTGLGIPFISALELRPLPNTSYQTQTGSLALQWRLDTGQIAANLTEYRYPDDVHDRFCTAATPKNGTHALYISWMDFDNSAEYFVYMHFAEFEKLQPNQSRQFNITMNGESLHEKVVPYYLSSSTIYSTRALSTGGQNNLSIFKAKNSTLPPILNAIEVYSVKEFLESRTNQADVDAITSIKSTYKIKKNWQGDPCSPLVNSWEGIDCSNEHSRIVSLNLSFSGLTGEIAPYISNLTMIHILDLSNNNLTGSIPDFLSRLRKLMDLNLEKNELTGLVPVGLIQRGRMVCYPYAVLWAGFKRKKQHAHCGDPFGVEVMQNSNQNSSLEAEGQRFTYPEIVEITRNFASIIGRGGFGEVYFGTLQNQTQVAVKLLISSSTQGSKEFENEVKLLVRAHHRNLVSLVGYCDEGETMALVYNFVANGNLQQRLSADVTLHVLTWKERLQIAVDAARGLDYLHNGCKPSIVHRDLKTSNILLNENLHAMIADFGLSKVLATESATHVSTDPKGTFGYLDPQYYNTGKLNKKSDIYSFGIVLLELITGRAAIIRDVETEPIHICRWVSPNFETIEIESIVDSRIQGTYNTSSAWKALQLAMACVSLKAIRRPDITFIYKDLKECLEIEMSSGRTQIVGNDDTSSSSSIRMASQIESETSSSSPVIISI